jgi:hypothetical protein
MASWELLLAHASHASMYLLFFAVPLIGWARSSAAGFPIVYFGLVRLPDLVDKDKALAASLTQAHAIAAYTARRADRPARRRRHQARLRRQGRRRLPDGAGPARCAQMRRRQS